MSSIPGAHASLGFGRKRVEFYAAPGVTAGEGRHRGEHEIRDSDGASHTLRLSRPDTPLETGETVTVLRAQSGPDHGSRPVSVINHDRNAWTRTSPDATGVLARSGVTRAFNWWMTMLLFMVSAILFAWPDIRLFMLEIDPALFASIPDINVFAMAAAQVPALQGYDLAASLPGFNGLVEQVSLPGWLTANTLAFAIPLTLMAFLTYLSRTWRIVWAPLYVLLAICTGLALGTESPFVPAMLALGGVALLFCLGGFFNRTRDAAKFEGRVARLSENILRNPPAETVSAPAATAGAALATGAALAGEAEDDTPADTAEDDDLPSDEELAAAQADSDEGEEDPAPVPSMRATEAEADPSANDTSDRDMVMPPPPPLANRSVNETGGSGEAGESVAEPESPVEAAAEPAEAPVAEAQAETPEPVETAEADAADSVAAPDSPAAPDAPSAAPLVEPADDTPAAEEVHSFESGANRTPLASSADIAEDSAEAESAETADAEDDEADPFMSPDRR